MHIVDLQEALLHSKGSTLDPYKPPIYSKYSHPPARNRGDTLVNANNPPGLHPRTPLLITK
jgi:hypothetical protein